MSLKLLIFAVFLLVWAGVLLLRRARRARGSSIVIDGSNLLYWRNETPDLVPLRALITRLEAARLRPVIWFDANAGYLVTGHYMGEAAFAHVLGLPRKQVFVAPKGTPADPLILQTAAALSARVVTNDRYRDWRESHPILNDPNRLIRGCWQDGALILACDLADAA